MDCVASEFELPRPVGRLIPLFYRVHLLVISGHADKLMLMGIVWCFQNVVSYLRCNFMRETQNCAVDIIYNYIIYLYANDFIRMVDSSVVYG